MNVFSRRAFAAWLCLGTTTMAAAADDFAWFLDIPAPTLSRAPPPESAAHQQQRVLEQIERFVASTFVVATLPPPRYFAVAADTTIIMVRKNFANAVAGRGADEAPFDAPDIVGSGLSMLQLFKRGWLWRKRYFGVAMTDIKAGQPDDALVVYFVLNDKR